MGAGMNQNPNHKNPGHKNPGQKKEAAETAKHRRTIYFVNIILLSCLAILSLLFALFVYFRTHTRGDDGSRRVYSESQIEAIRAEASQDAKNELLLQIQSSLESGKDTAETLREIFDGTIVVMNGGRYFFYPLREGVEKNPLSPGTLSCHDGTAEYTGGDPAVELTGGVLLSDRNGRIDWDRLAGSGIGEVVLTLGTLSENGFAEDVQLGRNLQMTLDRGLPCGLCLEITGIPEEEALRRAVETVRDASGRLGGASFVLLRLHTRETLTDGEKEQQLWTKTVRDLCGLLSGAGEEPVIGAGLYTFAAQLDLPKLKKYGRWLIDYDEKAAFPYSFLFWEYDAEGGMEGVPGDSVRYVRLSVRDAADMR